MTTAKKRTTMTCLHDDTILPPLNTYNQFPIEYNRAVKIVIFFFYMAQNVKTLNLHIAHMKLKKISKCSVLYKHAALIRTDISWCF